MTTPRSQTARRLLKAAPQPPWAARITHGHGTTTLGGLSADTDGNGKRHQITRDVPCQSEAVRLAHPDGRRAVAVWVSLDGGHKWAAWKPNAAWTWTHGELPKPIDIRTLIAHVQEDQ